jgi:hypothetical protein
MDYNNELQSIDNQNKAYLLGLFYADGNISKNQHHIRLGLTDEDLILLLKEKFPFFRYYIVEYIGNRQNMHYLYSGLKVLKEHFISNGCLPDKSFENKTNLHIPFKNELTRHFIRGFFDGDGGCTYINNSRKEQKRVYIYSNSLIFIKEIRDFLNDNNIDCSITDAKSVYKLTIFSLSYKRFYNLLYQDCEIYLLRKRILFEKILDSNLFIQRVTPNCKFCNSSNTVFNGNYIYKGIKLPRVLCKDCKNNFTLKTAPQSSNTLSEEDELLES